MSFAEAIQLPQQISRACGQQAAIPMGLLIGLPKSVPQAQTLQNNSVLLQYIVRLIAEQSTK